MLRNPYSIVVISVVNVAKNIINMKIITIIATNNKEDMAINSKIRKNKNKLYKFWSCCIFFKLFYKCDENKPYVF